MAGIKRLRSIAHSFAQHALGPLGPGMPERTLEQRNAAVAGFSFTLVGDSESDKFTTALRHRFEEFLSKENIPMSSVAHAKIEFLFKGQCRTPNKCRVTIQSSDGRLIEDTVTEAMRRETIPGYGS